MVTSKKKPDGFTICRPCGANKKQNISFRDVNTYLELIRTVYEGYKNIFHENMSLAVTDSNVVKRERQKKQLCLVGKVGF